MSGAPSPFPSPAAAAAAGAAAAEASSSLSPPPQQQQPSAAVDWRLSVQQSYRNVQVREIANVLAALEPGATTSSSKLRLAMQFEDTVFKQATSLTDYKKRLTKRLKKVQKSYVPSAIPTSATESMKATQLQQLRVTYGDKLLYILKHADAAVQQMRHKQGPDKATQLRQHIDGVQSWVNDLGLSLDGSTVQAPPSSLSEADLDNLRALLERRTENIRSHVVKLADPDRFLLETMEKTERDVTERGSIVLADACQQRYKQLSRATHNVNGVAMLQVALEGMHQSVPPPTRNQRNDIPAALIHLEKMRAACSLVLAWSLTPDKTVVALPSHRSLLAKAHGTVNEGIDFVSKVMVEFRQIQGRKGVTLEDAWMKVLRPSENGTDTSSTTVRPVLRSRVLLKPGRKVPSNLLHALQRKRATLIRPPPNGEGSHLRLEFEEAFTMTIYFVPLLVTLRAQASPTAAEGTLAPNHDDATQRAGVGCATLTPLSFGLSEPRRRNVAGSDTSATAVAPTPPEWRVWGATGTSETLGRAVEERLRDASARATFVLRQCFAASAKSTIASDFEVELLEATALLEFIQLARTTYIPDWQDDDV